ncbi:transferase hexapeptide (six repeat-containing protein) [Chitinophaga rupis]|uniref:Transferase hexapeptide (Six repeat-containing protein) n=1 Tax=Chitinophaga rupis TaxID=573321 RepID=A0A1H7LNN9_9BACT|nr:acyltransferase [Chitinophaga rupis]SEL00563.1 transferase hexapeptide (six repeat-containing protein) [Chitinophaga rupis]
MFIAELIARIKFWRTSDRLGPDMPLTHWRLHFKSKMLKLCKKKFLHFASTAEFRPGAYAIGCSKISIGERVVVRPGTHFHGVAANLDKSIIIEDDVLLGSGIHIYVGNHAYDNPDLLIIEQGHSECKPVILKKGCWIGANVVLLPGVTIGEHTVVGSGAVVTKSLPDRVVAGGVPAKIIKNIGPKSDSQNRDT